jgi:hypothetical protein
MPSFPVCCRALASGAAIPAFALWLAFAPRPALAAQGYDGCTGEITALPFTIAAPGTWCLKHDLSTADTSGGAVTVEADNVVVACNGFALRSTAGAGSLAKGVYVQDRHRVTVRDCRIEGFNIGVMFTANDRTTSTGHLVERNSLDRNVFSGIYLQGDDSVIRGNQVHRMEAPNTATYAIRVEYTVDILDNTIERVTSVTGDAQGIFMGDQSTRGSVIGNRIRGLSSGPNGGRVGIFASTASAEVNTIRNNDVANAGPFNPGDRAIWCLSSKSGARGNQMSGFPTGVLMCRDDGGNVLVP